MKSTNSRILYKYRNWSDSYHKDLLLKNQIYLASPKDFNDPFDCRIAPNFTLLDTKEKIQKYVGQVTIRHFEKLVSSNRDIKAEMDQIENRLSNDIEQIQLDHETELVKMQDTFFGIFSLSMRWDSILMWSHYSNCHRGICIGFWEEKLKNSGVFGAGFPIEYPPENKYPQINPFEKDLLKNIHIQTQTKAIDWEYEKEFRLSKLFYPNIPSENDRTGYISDDCFAEILIGINTPKKDRIEIIEIASSKGVKVFETFKSRFKFELERRELN